MSKSCCILIALIQIHLQDTLQAFILCSFNLAIKIDSISVTGDFVLFPLGRVSIGPYNLSLAALMIAALFFFYFDKLLHQYCTQLGGKTLMQ